MAQLRRIQVVRFTEGAGESSASAMLDLTASRFERTWLAGAMARWEQILDIARSAEGEVSDITVEEVAASYGRLSPRTLADADGLCVDALR